MQLINILSALPPLILLCIFAFLPESPRYLCAKGNTNAAKDVLRKFKELEDDVEHDVFIWSNKNLKQSSFRTVLKNQTQSRRLLPILGLIILDQFLGIWSIFSYLSWIFRISGGEYSPEVSSILVAGTFLIGIVLPKLFGVSWSDRRTLILTSILKAFILIILGFFIHYQGVYGQLVDYQYLPLVCMSLFVFLYGMGNSHISWKYVRILAPKSHYFTIRAIATSFNWLFLVVFTRAYPRLVEFVGIGWLFWFMSISCFSLAIFARFLVPDLDSLSTKYIFDEDDNSQHDCEQQSET